MYSARAFEIRWKHRGLRLCAGEGGRSPLLRGFQMPILPGPPYGQFPISEFSNLQFAISDFSISYIHNFASFQISEFANLQFPISECSISHVRNFAIFQYPNLQICNFQCLKFAISHFFEISNFSPKACL